MEATLSSRKRKRQLLPSNPLRGICTRSKSQIYLHQNRSCRARSDAIRRRFHAQSLGTHWTTKPTSSNQQEAINIDDLSQFFVKDLRARRVYSPPSLLDHGGTVIVDLKIDSRSQNLTGGNPKKKYRSGISFLNNSSPNLSDSSEEFVDITSAEVDGNLGAGEKGCDIPNLPLTTEDYCQKSGMGLPLMGSSSPRVVFPIEVGDTLTESKGRGDTAEEFVEVGQSEVEGGDKICLIASGSSSRNDVDRADILASRSKMVLNSRGRRRVFQSPSLFSYRRLLPFFMDIAKDDSCVPQIELVEGVPPSKIQIMNKISSNYSSFGNSLGKDEDSVGHLDGRNPAENGVPKDLDGAKPTITETEMIIGLHSAERINDGDDANNRADNVMQECDPTTPPDKDIYCKPEVHDRMSMKEDNVYLNENHMLGERNGSKAESFSPRKMVLNPCSRMKLFKAPGSVSYRRLLPFLKDIAKDNPGGKTIQEHVASIDEKLQPPVLASSLQDINVDIPETETNSGQHNIKNKEPDFPTLVLMDGSSNHMERNLVSSDEPHMPLDSLMQGTSQLELVSMDSPTKLEEEPPCDLLSHGNEECYSAEHFFSAYNHKCSPKGCTLELSKNLSFDTPEDRTSQLMGLKKIEKSQLFTSSLDQSFLQTSASNSSRSNFDSVRRSILKKNSRGCRGLCNCLNCVSFRLHAERAFEFSRNQMQDAEEVAMELIREITHLRDVLQKSTVDAKNLVVIEGNQGKRDNYSSSRGGDWHGWLWTILGSYSRLDPATDHLLDILATTSGYLQNSPNTVGVIVFLTTKIIASW